MGIRLRKLFVASLFSAVAAAALFTSSGCDRLNQNGGGGGGGTATSPTPTPSGASCTPYGFAPNFPAFNVDQTRPNLTLGPVCLTGQKFVGTVSLTLDIEGVKDAVGLCLPDGVYTFSSQGFVAGSCRGPVSPPLNVNVALDYVGDFRRTNPVCIQTSRVDYRSFTVTGTPLDQAISEAAKNDIHRSLDLELATRMNGVVNGSGAAAIPSNGERCANWTQLTRRPAPTP